MRAPPETKAGISQVEGLPESAPPKSATVNKLRIVLVDDHPLVRKALAMLINRETDLTVCGEAEDGPQAFALIEKLRPDLAVMDLSLKSTNGLELIKNTIAVCPRLPILVLSMHNEIVYAERALRAGALGYIMKDEKPQKMLEAIRRVIAGSIYVSQSVTSKVLGRLASDPDPEDDPLKQRLSERELEVFRLIGGGMGTRQIAEKLGVSVKTIETYRERVKEKLQLNSAFELVQHAVESVKALKEHP